MRLAKFFAAAVAVCTLTGGALAADLPTIKGPPAFVPPPPIFTWTGFYVGGQVGYAWGDTDFSFHNASGAFFGPPLPDYDLTGVIGGAHIGYNWQMGPLVLGLEGDVDGASYAGKWAPGPGFSTSTRIPIQGSIRGRVGYAFDHVLVYATGGIALADIKDTYTYGAFSDSFSTGRAGWTLGGGVEYAIDNNWSVRGEYRYTAFGFDSYNNTLTHTLGGGPYYFTRRQDENRVQVGFSYKFDWLAPPAPVVAKY